MLKIAGGFAALIRFCIARKPPNVVVFRHDASWIAAEGAAALAHSASRIASPSSPLTPGSAQLLLPPEGAGWIVENEPELYCARPKALRKVLQSALLYTSVSPITTMV